MLRKLFNPKDNASPGSQPAEAPANTAPQNKRAGGNSGAATKSKHGGEGGSGRQRNAKPKKRAADTHSDWSLDQFQVPEEAGKTRFHDLGLDDRLMHGIADAGFQYCSPIQAASLPHTLRGNDAIGKAQTGTGKTAAFLVTIFNDLLSNPVEEERFIGEPRALVIAPTRELVVQIGEDAKQLGKYCDLHVSTLIGGMDYQKQLERLNSSLVDIVVATPGRLLDFTGRRDLYLDQVEVLVIDEADRMLDMGFIPQVKRIVRQTPPKTHRQTLLFSATFTEDIIRLTEQWTYEPVRIDIEPEHVATDSVDQKVYLIESQDKFRCLLNVVRQPEAQSLIIFANRRDEVRRLHERLRKAGVSCGILSGEIPQNKRSRTLQDFKDGRIQCLVATDVAGRGIHVNGISHVVNYTLPEDPDDYVHRIGRTGRAGATGTSISFACEDDAFLLPAIEAELGMKLPCEQPPADLLS